MKVQEYGFKFNQLSRYAPHMVADSRAQMNKFLYRVSNLVKLSAELRCYLEILTSLDLLLKPNRLRVIIIGNRTRRILRRELGIMTILNRNWVVEIAYRVSKTLQPQLLSQLVFHPPITSMTRKLEEQTLRLWEVFQAPRLLFSLSVVGTI